MYGKVYVLLPALVSVLVALASCLPWGAPIPVEYALPMVSMAVIFYWTVKRPDQIPSPLVFLIGLFTDLATAGPLGFWALNFLIAVAIASHGLDHFADRREPIAVVIAFACAVIAVSIGGWLLSSLFFLRAMPFGPISIGALIAVVAYPAISYLFAPIDRAVGHALHADGLRKDDYV